jgi:heme-degrading monooxygenase HmoA
MYAVLIEVDVADVDETQGLQRLREQIVPAITHLPGFKSGTWLPGNDDGRGLSLTLWDTKEHAQTMADRFGLGTSPTERAFVARCELREVAATA